MADQRTSTIAKIENTYDTKSNNFYRFLTKQGGWVLMQDLITRLRYELELENLGAKYEALGYERSKNRRAIIGETAWLGSFAVCLAMPVIWIGHALFGASFIFFCRWSKKKRKLLPQRRLFSPFAILDFMKERSRISFEIETGSKRLAELRGHTDPFGGLNEAVREPLRRLVEAVIRYNEKVDLQVKALEVWEQQQKRQPGEDWPMLKQVMDVLHVERPRLDAAIVAAERACVAVAVEDTFIQSVEVTSCLDELRACLDDFESSAQVRLDAHIEAALPAGK